MLIRHGVIRFLLVVFVLGFAYRVDSAWADALSECSEHIPWGAPTLKATVHVRVICHTGYLSALDTDLKVPRWVAYTLTGPHTLGCFKRDGLNFKRDDGADPDEQATLADYSGSGFQLGHMAPNQDFAFDEDEQRESFSFANVAPQVGGMNAQGWERGEEYVRAWALSVGEVVIYVGPIIGKNDNKIGDDVDVPNAFFKIVIDPKTGDGFGIVMQNKPIKKQSLAPFMQTIAQIETLTRADFPLPSGFHMMAGPTDDELKAWRKAHRDACADS